MEKESINIGLEKNISLPITDRFYFLKNKIIQLQNKRTPKKK